MAWSHQATNQIAWANVDPDLYGTTKPQWVNHFVVVAGKMNVVILGLYTQSMCNHYMETWGLIQYKDAILPV